MMGPEILFFTTNFYRAQFGAVNRQTYIQKNWISCYGSAKKIYFGVTRIQNIFSNLKQG